MRARRVPQEELAVRQALADQHKGYLLWKLGEAIDENTLRVLVDREDRVAPIFVVRNRGERL